jgi:Phage integrase family
VRVRLEGINTVRKRLADGTVKTYHYHRATGLRLVGLPGSPEFIASYGDAEKATRDRHAGSTLNALIRGYTLSIEFQQRLAPSTQTEYRRMLTAAETEFGDMPIAALDDPRVRKDFLDWREKVARKSGGREADNRLSAISAMLTWATDRGQVVANHLRGFRRLYHADRSEIIWLPEHIAAFMKVAPLEMQRALILALHSGQREGDLLRLPWSSYDGAWIKLRQSKARRRGVPGPLVEIPCTTALRRMLDKMERTSAVILTTKTGQSFKKRYFARLWDEAMKAAALQRVKLPGLDQPVDLHFHDLRGTSVTLLSEAGCTAQQVAAITGHSLKTVHCILERYLARTRGLAEQAIFNFENSSRTIFANQLQTGTDANAIFKAKGEL